MSARGDSLLEWVKSQRDANAHQQELMSHWFDLDGAVRAGQWELAWRARQGLLMEAIELFLHERGVRLPGSLDVTEQLCIALDAVAALNPALADTLWDLVLRDGPSDELAMRREVDEMLRVVRSELSIPLSDRLDSIEMWADGVRVLREVAAGMRLTGSDAWYLSAADPSAQLGWYDEVLALLEEQRRRG
ncbi:hypothetical protein AB0H83_36855 [Dactylosporangium sp. NPDC050688]|uniref:hypothetical protein n=1 Tax=Dactylosporangium sp. NPDC050688 TaxID=3157217 RepID=UPI0033D5F196